MAFAPAGPVSSRQDVSKAPTAARTALHALARLTRQFHPPGTDRLIRLVHPPANARPIRTVVDYDDGLALHVDTASFCEWYIFFYGAFRPRVSALLNRLLHPGQVALDIGANIGMHSLIMANRVGPTGRVACFEPDPHPRARLTANLALNGFDFVEVVPAAVSATSGQQTLFLHDASIGNFANASLHSENVGQATEGIEIETVSLDDFVARRGLQRLDLVKVLAQGEEINVFRGGEATFRRFRPKVFFLYEPAYWQRLGVKLADAVGFFTGLGYTSVQIIEFGPRREVTGEIEKGQVLLAVP